MYQPDQLDLAILAELESNARVGISKLARRLDCPNSTVRDRIRRLEKEGVICGYTTIVDARKLGFGIKAVVKITRSQGVSLDDMLSEPEAVPEITAVTILTGETDEHLTLYARDIEHLKELLFSQIGELPGIALWSSSIVIDERRFPFIARMRSRSEP